MAIREAKYWHSDGGRRPIRRATSDRLSAATPCRPRPGARGSQGTSWWPPVGWLRHGLGGEPHVGEGGAGYLAGIQPPAEFPVADASLVRADEAAEHGGEFGAWPEAGHFARLEPVSFQDAG